MTIGLSGWERVRSFHPNLVGQIFRQEDRPASHLCQAGPITPDPPDSDFYPRLDTFLAKKRLDGSLAIDLGYLAQLPSFQLAQPYIGSERITR
jgi:ABC-type phosphate transport system auxiliary subunit